MTNRRSFLVKCSKAIAVGTVVSRTTQAAERFKSFSSGDLNFTSFERNLQSFFAVSAKGAGRIYLKLAQVRSCAPRIQKAGLATEQFSIRFEGAVDQELSQGSYNFEHEDLGGFTLFIVPNDTSNPSRKSYEALFNQVIRRERIETT